MEIILQRKSPIGIALPGELTIARQHAAWTLENVQDAIPIGRYEVTIYYSLRFQRLMPLLMDVPGKSGIEIHWGSFPQNYKGCIGVGSLTDPATGDIFKTQEKFLELFPAIKAAAEAEGCWITVQNGAYPVQVLSVNQSTQV